MPMKRMLNSKAVHAPIGRSTAGTTDPQLSRLGLLLLGHLAILWSSSIFHICLLHQTGARSQSTIESTKSGTSCANAISIVMSKFGRYGGCEPCGETFLRGEYTRGRGEGS